MKEDEDIVAYLLQVDEIVNTIKGLGVEVDESMIVQKVSRSLLEYREGVCINISTISTFNHNVKHPINTMSIKNTIIQCIDIT
jgi:hypothetical protein